MLHQLVPLPGPVIGGLGKAAHASHHAVVGGSGPARPHGPREVSRLQLADTPGQLGREVAEAKGEDERLGETEHHVRSQLGAGPSENLNFRY